jgi:hypothetical protein
MVGCWSNAGVEVGNGTYTGVAVTLVQEDNAIKQGSKIARIFFIFYSFNCHILDVIPQNGLSHTDIPKRLCGFCVTEKVEAHLFISKG